MEVIKKQSGNVLDLSVRGRLDGYWADHLNEALEQVVREGGHRIRLDLSEVGYMSSAGIGVLVKFYKQLSDIQGALVVASASPQVKRVLEMAHLGMLLAPNVAPTEPTMSTVKMVGHLDRERPTFEVRDVERGAKLGCRVVGDPDLLRGCRFGRENARKMLFPDSTFAVGLGAFGNTFEDCCGRFGEFLAVAGAAAYMPTDGTNVPDYLVAAGNLFPEMMALYAVLCEGPFAHLARFEAKKDSTAAGITDIVTSCLDIAGSDVAGIVMVAESAGLIGAALRKSPAAAEAGESAPFQHPEIRDWLSFTAERAYVRAVTLVVGVAARADCGELAAMLRPLGGDTKLMGHFHAAAFSYRPLQKGRIELKPTVAGLFENQALQGVLHLVADDREIAGVGQSEFIRGACWTGPVGEIRAEGK